MPPVVLKCSGAVQANVTIERNFMKRCDRGWCLSSHVAGDQGEGAAEEGPRAVGGRQRRRLWSAETF